MKKQEKGRGNGRKKEGSKAKMIRKKGKIGKKDRDGKVKKRGQRKYKKEGRHEEIQYSGKGFGIVGQVKSLEREKGRERSND